MRVLTVLLLALLALGIVQLVTALWRRLHPQPGDRWRKHLLLLLLLGAVVASGAWQLYRQGGTSRSADSPASRPSATLVPETEAPVILAAGDIASCDSKGG